MGLTLEATVVKNEQLTYMVNKQTIQLLYSANKIYLLAHELDKIGKQSIKEVDYIFLWERIHNNRYENVQNWI